MSALLVFEIKLGAMRWETNRNASIILANYYLDEKIIIRSENVFHGLKNTNILQFCHVLKWFCLTYVKTSNH
jgi:hypothetical protein